MRIKFCVLSALVGCIALLFALVPGRTQNPGAPPINRESPERRPPPVSTQQPAVPPNWADDRFLRLDRDGDGHLSFDEMPGPLRAEKDKWDRNGDGRIDLEEWRTFLEAYLAQQRQAANNPGTPPPPPPPVQRPPQFPPQFPRTQGPGREPRDQNVTRPPFIEGRAGRASAQRNKGNAPHAGKFPSNLPAWFKAYDVDGDGQIALYEWKNKKDAVSEFQKYDLNQDGLITVEELIRAGQFVTNTPAPLTVNSLRAEVGEFFYFEVTGTTTGGIWGTDVYTADSPIATAAVHAGVLKPGQTSYIKVTILPGQNRYDGSFRNGVFAQSFGTFAKSFRVEEAPQAFR